VPSYIKVLQRFGIVSREAKLPKHAAWSTFSQVAADPEVMRVRQTIELQQRSVGGLFGQQVFQVEAALAHMSDEQILRLRGRLLSQDFRLDKQEKGENEK
jgi:hypothetical protein